MVGVLPQCGEQYAQFRLAEVEEMDTQGQFRAAFDAGARVCTDGGRAWR
jgi:hypothetical protein